MTSDVEPAKKILLPYLQRADELQKHEPLVAYYCRLYGMERGLKIPAKERTKTTNAILISLMNQLEKDKKTVQLSPDDNLYVEGFALSVFAKADKQDRAGRADLNTAKTFYAASIFIEILYQFGPLQPDIEQKQKYAVWKAADIRKALSEGRKPVPGPPGGGDDFLPSPSGSMDSAVINDALAGALEGRSFVQQTSNAGVEMGSPRLDGESRRTSSQAAPHPDDHDYYGSEAPHPDDHWMPQQPPFDISRMPQQPPFDVSRMPQQPPFDVSRSSHTQQAGYGTAYPGSYHPSRPADPPTASPSISASPHGSMSEMDIYNSQPQVSHYHDYTQAAPSGHMYNNPPTAYTGNNGSPDVQYYQSQGHAPSTVAYPASSAPFSAEYSSFAGSRDPSGLDRTTSAPVPPVKVQTYQPTPEKVAEAQKAARFAVSALAFDDVPTAVTYLKQSLELLTGPSSG